MGERPTDHIPRIRDDAQPPDVSLTGPIQPHLVRDRRGADDAFESDGYDPDGYEQDNYEPDDGGPSTMVGAAPAGAEAWHRDRTSGRRGAAPADDGGPPTEASAPLDFDDRPAGLGGRGYNEADSFSDGFDDFYGTGQHEPVRPPVHQPPRRDGRRGLAGGGRNERYAPDEPDGFLDGLDGDEPEPVEDEQPAPRRRLVDRVTDTAGQAWAAVLAQWIAGAVGGAALWVGFRFLWRSLPVVAIAAAALVTVGLVVVVRALLRNDDMRTTMFAVLVGLLLTVSPAILVLLGR